MGRRADAEKRARILASAFRVFGEQGFTRTTMKGIAERAGIVPGSIYIYFRGKEALFEATVEQGWQRFLSELDRAAFSPRPLRERLETVIDLGFSELRRSLPLLQGMLFEASRRRLLQDKLEGLCRTLERLFREERREPPRIGAGRHGKTMIRITVMGILFSAALAPPERIEPELSALKAAVRRLLAERLGP